MSSEYQQWQEVKENYLKLIEKNLARVDHPQRSEILANVREHLDSKYAELFPEQKNWESFQQIITEMGPPEDYAELLDVEPSEKKKWSGINELLAVIFVIVLAAVGSYLVYNAKTNLSQQPVIQKTIIKNAEFELDKHVLGQWRSVDFVKLIDDFDPSKKNCQMELYLEGLDFQDKGVVWWLIKDKKHKHHWTKGKVNPFSERPAYYYLRSIDGNDYLFFEWISGDVTIRGREPSYYVLKRATGDYPEIPDWFENDPQPIGYWTAVDFVETTEDFQPEKKQAEELFIKTLLFKDNGKLLWTVGQSKPMALDWTKGKIRPFDVWPTVYSIKQIDGDDYLFYQHRTKYSNPAGYYVFKQTPISEKVEQKEGKSFMNDPQALGQWTTIDFVETPDVFQPNQQSWRGEFWVKKLDFKEQGIVEWY
ncbi:MAG: HAAS signaling domain-containing protein, partial [Planctomycetota bacterium]